MRCRKSRFRRLRVIGRDQRRRSGDILLMCWIKKISVQIRTIQYFHNPRKFALSQENIPKWRKVSLFNLVYFLETRNIFFDQENIASSLNKEQNYFTWDKPLYIGAPLLRSLPPYINSNSWHHLLEHDDWNYRPRRWNYLVQQRGLLAK